MGNSWVLELLEEFSKLKLQVIKNREFSFDLDLIRVNAGIHLRIRVLPRTGSEPSHNRWGGVVVRLGFVYVFPRNTKTRFVKRFGILGVLALDLCAHNF